MPFGIPIRIPIGARHIVTVQGAAWRLISCANCQQPFAYLLELEATGEGMNLLFLDGEAATEQAQAKAEEILSEKAKNLVTPVPCPTCGFYQDDMSRRLKEDASTNSLQIAGAVIAALSLAPLALRTPNFWMLTVVVAAAGLALLIYGYVIAFRFDPNAGDPEPRMLIGRQQAVWGERLAKLIAKPPPA
jgi:hypothetical protein